MSTKIIKCNPDVISPAGYHEFHKALENSILCDLFKERIVNDFQMFQTDIKVQYIIT